MEDWYSEMVKRQEVLASTLTPLPKDLKFFSQFNDLKAAVIHKIETDKNIIPKNDLEGLETFKENDIFGFKERLVNVLMHYAYIAGQNSIKDDFTKRTKEMDNSLKKIADILDDLGYNPNDSNN